MPPLHVLYRDRHIYSRFRTTRICNHEQRNRSIPWIVSRTPVPFSVAGGCRLSPLLPGRPRRPRSKIVEKEKEEKKKRKKKKENRKKKTRFPGYHARRFVMYRCGEEGGKKIKATERDLERETSVGLCCFVSRVRSNETLRNAQKYTRPPEVSFEPRSPPGRHRENVLRIQTTGVKRYDRAPEGERGGLTVRWWWLVSTVVVAAAAAAAATTVVVVVVVVTVDVESRGIKKGTGGKFVREKDLVDGLEGTRMNGAATSTRKRTGRNLGRNHYFSYSFSARRRVATRRACTTMPTTVGKSLHPLARPSHRSHATRRIPITPSTLGLSPLYGTDNSISLEAARMFPSTDSLFASFADRVRTSIYIFLTNFTIHRAKRSDNRECRIRRTGVETVENFK